MSQDANLHASTVCCKLRRAAPAVNAHDGAVVGLAVDAANRLLVSGGYDGRLRVWAFKVRRRSPMCFCFFFKEGHVLQETALGRNARHAKPRQTPCACYASRVAECLLRHFRAAN